ncbi:MAG: electron transport complex subunit RsxC [Paludibacteraceae bacterium]|nr:electron transport complex subunit RsxC [Paludibacteraceae bacterium]MBP9648070.1 electron transport complex subunit RsxC [Paludibacteraceae bacterium]
MKTFTFGGIHTADMKLSAGKKIQIVPIPSEVIIPLEQHIGAPTNPVVAVGETVKVGQLIGKAVGFISANIHSSVSGKVTKIDTVIDAWGYKRPAVYIAVEGDEWMENIDKKDVVRKEITTKREDIIQKIADAGIVGLGGACFPTHVKLSPPPNTKAELLLINAVECEPYLTCDHQLMLEKAEEIIVGIQILMTVLQVNKAIIGIENNKKDAISLLQQITRSYSTIEVCPLAMCYPQGGEKQLIEAITKKQVPSGQLPINIGIVVQNVATTYAIYEAVQKNKPLIERVITVTGKKVAKPGNFLVRIGTPLRVPLDMAGGMPEDTGKIIGGGPMMGRAFMNADVPVTKRSAGLLVMPTLESARKEMQNCIRCAKCVTACPMGLEPYLLMSQAEKSMWKEMEETYITDCIECGCCLFSCPSNRPLLDYLRMGKSTVLEQIRNRVQKVN